jgi:toxin ParE1/3/4
VPKKYKVKITHTAASDLDYIWDYISQDSPHNAVAFLNEMEEKVRGLDIFPDRYPFIPESEILQTKDYRHLIHKSYRSIFKFSHDTVYVMRIFHGAKLLDTASLD